MHQQPQGESIWGTINSCVEIALDIYMIIARDENGDEYSGIMAKKEGDWLCYDENTKDIPMYEVLQRKMIACKWAEAAIIKQMGEIKWDGKVALSDYFGERRPPVETPYEETVDLLPIRNAEDSLYATLINSFQAYTSQYNHCMPEDCQIPEVDAPEGLFLNVQLEAAKDMEADTEQTITQEPDINEETGFEIGS